MALERTALRLSTVMMLANGFNAPFPTLAGARVFDSRIDEMQITTGQDLYPIIKVCTDADSGTSISANNGGPPFERSVELSIDLYMAVPSEDGAFVGAPFTEPELELALDQFEAQVERLLLLRPGVWGGHFNRLARRITDYVSTRYVERDGNARLAARQITMSVLVPVDKTMDSAVTIVPSVDPPAPGDAVVPAPLGLLLDDIIAHAPNYAADAARIQDTLISGGIAATREVPALERLRIIEDERDAQNRPTTTRAEGVAHIEFPSD